MLNKMYLFFIRMLSRRPRAQQDRQILNEMYLSVIRTSEFIGIDSMINVGIIMLDPKKSTVFLSLDASDEELGGVIFDAYKNIYTPTQAELDEEFFSIKLATESYVKWVDTIKKKFGYKSKRSMFSNMDTVEFKFDLDSIVLEPRAHSSLEGWEAIVNDQKEVLVIKLAKTATPAELGRACREAFELCIPLNR